MKIWTIIKKELARVFTDKRVIFSLFILPPLTIYLIYGLMGMSAQNETNKAEEYTPIIYVMDAPEAIGNVPSLETVFLNSDIKAEYHFITTVEELTQAKTDLENKTIDLVVEFPADFVTQVVPYQADVTPEINLYYNINKTYSQNAYYTISAELSRYNMNIAGTRVDLNQLTVFTLGDQPVGNVEQAKGTVLGMILPLLLVIYLMAGAMGVGIESIAGEKERGTIATLLVTPIKRSELAIGKIISIAIIAVLSSIASFLGLLAVMPTFAKIGGGGSDAFQSVSYGLRDYGMIFAVMFTAVLLFVALIVIVSTYAKSTKEAGTLVMPIYLVVMGASFFTMFTQEAPTQLSSYLIPIYNITVALKGIFNFDLSIPNFIATVVSTVVYTTGLIFLIQKMFRSEKVMFSK